jgi:hypothetical protein
VAIKAHQGQCLNIAHYGITWGAMGVVMVCLNKAANFDILPMLLILQSQQVKVISLFFRFIIVFIIFFLQLK